MRYENLRAFEKHLEETALSHLQSLYFIMGKEPFECQEATQLLLRVLLPSSEMREFALTTFEATQLEEEELGNALYSGSFFAKTRVILIQQAEKLKKSVQESLEKYLSRPLRDQYLILTAAGWQKNTHFYKTLEKEGIVLEFVELKPWEKEKRLVEWVNQQATAARKLISYQACQLLVKRTNQDQALLAQELEKLVSYCADKKDITVEDIETLCSCLQVDSVWQLGEALFRRDVAAALQMVHAIVAEGQPLLPLLRQIRSQFQTEYQVSLLLAQGKQMQEISQEFPYMKGQILERHLQQARQYGLEAFKKGLLALDAAEMRAKNSLIDEKILLELLMIELCEKI